MDIYTGVPGSGKSLEVAQDILRAMLLGHRVIANFPINPPKRYRDRGRMPLFVENEDLTPVYLLKYARKYHKEKKEYQTLLVIDECQIIFNARDMEPKLRKSWVDFFSHHQKFGFHVILVTQWDRLIDRQIRSMAEFEVRHRKLTNYSGGSFFISFLVVLLRLFGAKIFVSMKSWYGVKEKPERKMYIYRRKYSKIYDRFRDFGMEFEEEIKKAEAAVKKRNPPMGGTRASGRGLSPDSAVNAGPSAVDTSEDNTDYLEGVFTRWGFKFASADTEEKVQAAPIGGGETGETAQM